MKKLFILCLLLISMSTVAQNTLSFEPTLELGYEDRPMQFGEVPFHWLESVYFGDLTASASYKGFNLHTNVKTFFIPIEMANYRPLQTEYAIGISYSYSYYTFSMYHMCSHSNDGIVFRENINRISLKIKLYDTR